MKNLKIAVMFFAFVALFIAVGAPQAEEEKALFFDGQDDYIECPHIPLDTYKEFTIEVWVKNWVGYILSQGDAGEPENSIWMSSAFGGYDGCGWEGEDGPENYAIYAPRIPIDQWIHLALVYDGKRQYLFMNGTLVKKHNVPKLGPLTINRSFTIGMERNPGGTDNWNYGAGLLKSIKISKKAQYLQDFDPIDKMTTDKNTILLYNSNNIDKRKILDLSKNKKHGVLHDPFVKTSKDVTSAYISGTVKGNDGKAIPNAWVLLYDGTFNINFTNRWSQADANGQYQLVAHNLPKDFKLLGATGDSFNGGIDIELTFGDKVEQDILLYPSNYTKFGRLSWLVGDWIHARKSKSGKIITTNISCEEQNNGNLIEYIRTDATDSKVTSKIKGIIEWDPIEEKLKVQIWNEMGGKGLGTIEIASPDTSVWEFEKMDVNGKRSSITQILGFENTSHIFIQNVTVENGKINPTGEKREFKRVSW